MNMVFDKMISVDRVIVPDMSAGMPFKEWKKMAAREMAEFILKKNLMTHHSHYDVRRGYTHEAFTCLVARPERRLP